LSAPDTCLDIEARGNGKAESELGHGSIIDVCLFQSTPVTGRQDYPQEGGGFQPE
jgi:hypothetical protein